MTPKERKFDEEFNPPATAAQIADAEHRLGIRFPEEIKAVYLNYDGITEYKSRNLPFRLMPLSEVITTYEIVLNREGIIRKYGIIYFWADDESNYAGMFLKSPMTGAISFLDHDGYYVGILSPLFRDLHSFIVRVVELAERNLLVRRYGDGEIEESELKKTIGRFPYEYYAWNEEAYWHAIPVDYPASADGPIPGAQEVARVDFVKRALDEKLFTVEDEREFLVYCLARLISYRDASLLLPYLEEDHMFIPSEVCHTLFLRRFKPAIPAIVKLMVAGNQNCRTTAEMTLAKFLITGSKMEADAIKGEFQGLSGDYEQLMATVDSIKESPTLMYQ